AADAGRDRAPGERRGSERWIARPERRKQGGPRDVGVGHVVQAAVGVRHGVLGRGAYPQRPRLVMRAPQQVTHLVGWIEWVIVGARGWRSDVPGAWITPIVPEAVFVEVLNLRRIAPGKFLSERDGCVIHHPPQRRVSIGGDQVDPGPPLAELVTLVGGVERQVHP